MQQQSHVAVVTWGEEKTQVWKSLGSFFPSQYFRNGGFQYHSCDPINTRSVIARQRQSTFVYCGELVDAECYRLAYEFVCQLLQPSCLPRLPTYEEDSMVLPCRGFCQEFHMGCGSRIPDKLKDMLNCNTFPDYIGTGSCIPKPGCRALKERFGIEKSARQFCVMSPCLFSVFMDEYMRIACEDAAGLEMDNENARKQVMPY
ncbi:unnamed protein product [Timema podura]|uniref:FZ domain-containing protein n=1 Tax=Timema podura TaxID=61482 RepID=A0ABN7PB05_TIMPD|nr:unnamed protein product [Timema podura]